MLFASQVKTMKNLQYKNKLLIINMREFGGNMQNNLLDKYLNKCKDFWNVPDVKIAMYRRILTDFSKPYDELDFNEQLTNWNSSIKESLTQIFNTIESEPQWKILEIGCGIGRLIGPLREIYAQVDGVDISEKMVEYSKEYLSDARQNGTIYVNDGMSFPMLQDNTYDFVYSMITFQHIRSYSVVKSYLQETMRVLKNGGCFRLQVLKSNEKMGAYNEECNPDVDYRFFGNSYSEEELKTILEEVGFSDIEVTHDQNGLWLWSTSKKIC